MPPRSNRNKVIAQPADDIVSSVTRTLANAGNVAVFRGVILGTAGTGKSYLINCIKRRIAEEVGAEQMKRKLIVAARRDAQLTTSRALPSTAC
jgi:hypothetical protein